MGKRKRTRNKRTKRNDPCPCGSGEKFKRCCGNLEERRTQRAVAQAVDSMAAPGDPSQAPFAVNATMVAKFRHDHTTDIKAAMAARGLSREDVVELSGLSRVEVDDVLDCRGEGYMEDLTAVAAAVGYEIKTRKRMTLEQARARFADALDSVPTIHPALTAALRHAETPNQYIELSAIFGDPNTPRPTPDQPAELARWTLAYTFNNVATCIRRGHPAFAEEILVMMSEAVVNEAGFKALPSVTIPDALLKRHQMRVVPPEPETETSEPAAETSDPPETGEVETNEPVAQPELTAEEREEQTRERVAAVVSMMRELDATDERVLTRAELEQRFDGSTAELDEVLERLSQGYSVLVFPGPMYSLPATVRAGSPLTPLRGQTAFDLVSAVDGTERGQYKFEVPSPPPEPVSSQPTSRVAAKPLSPPTKFRTVREVLQSANAYDDHVMTRAEIHDRLSSDRAAGDQEIERLARGYSIIMFPGELFSLPRRHVRAGSPPAPMNGKRAGLVLVSAVTGERVGSFRFRDEHLARFPLPRKMRLWLFSLFPEGSTPTKLLHGFFDHAWEFVDDVDPGEVAEGLRALLRNLRSESLGDVSERRFALEYVVDRWDQVERFGVGAPTDTVPTWYTAPSIVNSRR